MWGKIKNKIALIKGISHPKMHILYKMKDCINEDLIETVGTDQLTNSQINLSLLIWFSTKNQQKNKNMRLFSKKKWTMQGKEKQSVLTCSCLAKNMRRALNLHPKNNIFHYFQCWSRWESISVIQKGEFAKTLSDELSIVLEDICLILHFLLCFWLSLLPIFNWPQL